MPNSMLHQAVLFEKKPNDVVKCTACNNYCLIPKDTSGICGVRRNIDGNLYLLVYGQAVAANIDPMEKKPLYHFLPGKQVFSIGTIGCNFGCEFCQNWDISQASKNLRMKPLESGKEILEYGYKLSPEEIIETCKKKKIPAVAFTYNEPVIFFEYAFDTMKLAKKAGIKTVFVSNGYESAEALEKMKGYLDAINIDLKSFSDDFYKKICHARLQPVLKTIRKCHELGIWVEVTTLIVPGENDSDEELNKIANFIAGIDKNIPWHISAFRPDYKMTDKKSTPADSLARAYELGKKRLNHVYVGNIHDPERSATYCPDCRKELINRVHYIGELVGMKGNSCKYCGEKIAGVFQ